MKATIISLSVIGLCLGLKIKAQDQAPSVRVIYLVSADRQERADYKAAIEMAILDIQKWYRKQLNGRTFRLNEPIVEVLKSNQPANWFTGTPIPGVGEGDWGFQHTLSEIKRLLPNESIPGNYTWVMYSDGPGSSGRGGGQICYLPEDDFLGLTGQHPTQKDIPRWIAGLGHEIGHAFGLPHPQDTKKHADAIMWTGIYGKYPDQTYLTPEDKAHLSKSPFFITDEEIANRKVVHQTVYSFHGGTFTRNITKGGEAFWIEDQDYLQDSYHFEETRKDEQYYYALGRSIVTIKIPINGGHSYYSGDDGKNWTRNHYVTMTSDEPVAASEEIEETIEAAAEENKPQEQEGDNKPATPVIKLNVVTDAAVLEPCRDPKELTIQGAVEATDITFVNHLTEAVQLFWIDYDQNPVAYSTLQPDEKVVQGTYSNHWWIAKTTNGECIGVFRNKKKAAVTVDIERKVKAFKLHTVDESGLKRN